MRHWIYSSCILVILLTGCDFVDERIEENQPRDWKVHCKENPKDRLCWGGDKAPWVGGPYCHNIPRTGDQAPGTAVRCNV